MDKIPFPVLWLIIVVVLGIIEAASFNLITIWFALGAVVAMISSFFGIPFIYQVVIFVISSALLLYFTKPIVKKYLNVKKEKTNAGIVEELDIESLNEVTGGALRNTIRTQPQDISGDTKAKI